MPAGRLATCFRPGALDLVPRPGPTAGFVWELKNQIGLGRLRLRRPRFVREQFFLAAVAQNIKRLVRFPQSADNTRFCRSLLSRTETRQPATARSQMKSRSVEGLFQHPRPPPDLCRPRPLSTSGGCSSPSSHRARLRLPISRRVCRHSMRFPPVSGLWRCSVPDPERGSPWLDCPFSLPRMQCQGSATLFLLRLRSSARLLRRLTCLRRCRSLLRGLVAGRGRSWSRGLLPQPIRSWCCRRTCR